MFCVRRDPDGLWGALLSCAKRKKWQRPCFQTVGALGAQSAGQHQLGTTRAPFLRLTSSVALWLPDDDDDVLRPNDSVKHDGRATTLTFLFRTHRSSRRVPIIVHVPSWSHHRIHPDGRAQAPHHTHTSSTMPPPIRRRFARNLSGRCICSSLQHVHAQHDSSPISSRPDGCPRPTGTPRSRSAPDPASRPAAASRTGRACSRCQEDHETDGALTQQKVRRRAPGGEAAAAGGGCAQELWGPDERAGVLDREDVGEEDVYVPGRDAHQVLHRGLAHQNGQPDVRPREVKRLGQGVIGR